MINHFSAGLADLGRALAMHRVWSALAAEDVTDAHRRTTLGPAWLLVNYFVFVSTFVLLFGQATGIENYAAFVAIGLLVWTYIADTIGPATTLFVREQAMIMGTNLPLSVYVFKHMSQHVIRFAYALGGCLGILLLIVGIYPTVDWLYTLVGLAMLLLVSPAVIIVVAMLGTWLPDSGFVVNNLLRVGIFLTPVMWQERSGPALLQAIYAINPATHFINVVRAPVLGHGLPVDSLLIAGCWTLGLWVLAVLLLGVYRDRVVFAL